MKISPIKSFYIFAVFAFSISLMACSDTAPPKTIAELMAAPEEISINGQNYTLSTYLWRDFMPPSTGSDLMAVIKLSEKNLLTIPANIDVVHLWVVNGAEIWSTGFTDEAGAGTPAYQLEKIARYGPKWDTNIIVDVVVKVTDGTGAEYLLKVPAQLIYATS